MKCIHYYMPDNRIERVTDDEAAKAVAVGRARYISKGEWKRKVRDLLKRA